MIKRRLLVVGARAGNLGDHIAGAIGDRIPSVLVGDIVKTQDHDFELNVTDRKMVIDVLEYYRPTDIVCTVGINLPDGEPGELVRNMERQLKTNTLGPVMLLVEAVDMWMRSMIPPETGFNFVAVSSNSAHIARSTSAGYCASKAALSIALRSVARRWADTGAIHVWGYEPGWIGGTPMSEDVLMRLPTGVKPHRIPGGRGLSSEVLGRMIADDLVTASRSMNGCLLRIDGGEQ